MRKVSSVLLSLSLVFLLIFNQPSSALGVGSGLSIDPSSKEFKGETGKIQSFTSSADFKKFSGNFDSGSSVNGLTNISLSFNPVDTVMDPTRPIIYMTDGDTNKVHSVNYLTGEIKTIQLNLQPERITFANNEVYVTLLKMTHEYYTNQPLQGAIAIINADNFTKVAQFDINTDPYDIAADGSYIYVSPGSNQWENLKVYSRSTGAQVANVGGMRAWSFIHMYPLSSKIYTIDTDTSPRDIDTYTFNNGAFVSTYDSPYHGDYALTTNMRISPDGKYIFNGSGNIFKCSNAREYDMTYLTALDSGFKDIAFDLQSNRVYTALTDGNIGVYDYTNFSRIGTLSLSGKAHSMYYQNGKLTAVVQNSQNMFEVVTADVESKTNPSEGLKVIDAFPPSNTADMAVEGFLFLRFNAFVKINTSITAPFTLTSSQDSTNRIMDYGAVDDVLALYYNNLAYNTKYTLNVKAGALTDYTGAPLNSDYTISFTTGPEFTRLSGRDRYETCIAISQKGWESSQYVILATGEDYPDALCAAPLATAYSAPILLTEPTSLNPMTEAEITRLGAKTVIIVGGPGVVSGQTEAYLKLKGLKVERLYGNSRYDTSLAIANYLGATDEVFVATGENFPDALSIASYAAFNRIPILLTEYGSLPANTSNYIRSNNISRSYVIGGAGVISDSVLYSLPNPERIAGKDRYETNIRALSKFNFLFINTFIATGENYPDALSGSALAGLMNAPVILVDDKNMPQEVIDNLRQNRDIMKMKYILGGTGVVSEEILNRIFK